MLNQGFPSSSLYTATIWFSGMVWKFSVDVEDCSSCRDPLELILECLIAFDLPSEAGMLGNISDALAWFLNRSRCVSVRTRYTFLFLNMPCCSWTSPWWRTVWLEGLKCARLGEWTEVGVEEVRVRSSSSSLTECRERNEPKMLKGRPDFCKLFGRGFGENKRSMLLFELVRSRPEFEWVEVGLEEGSGVKNDAGRRFLRVVAPGGSSSSSIGVRGFIEDWNMLRLFRRR